MIQVFYPHRRNRIRFLLVTLVLIILINGMAGAAVHAQPEAGLAAGLLHSALINYDGQLYIWGDNTYGQLGLPEIADYSDTPQLLSLPGQIAAVSLGGYHSLALLADGSVWAWGRNSLGQLGIGNTINSATPTQVVGLPAIAAISAGAWHSMALGIDGSVWAWGSNGDLQVGDVSSESITNAAGVVLGSRCILPAQVIAGGMAAIAAGGMHSLCLDTSGRVYAWGDNSRGQLGDGSTQPHARPVQIAGLQDIRQIVAGYQHNLALSVQNGQDALLVWGDDSLGQLGIGSDPAAKSSRTLPERLDITGDQDPANDRIFSVTAGYTQSAAIIQALTPEGIEIERRQQLLVWGNNSSGQLALGDAGSRNRPVAVGGTFNGWTGHDFLPFDAMALGGYHFLVLSSKGLLAAAGSSDLGQLGNQSVLERHVLVPVDIPDVIRPAWPRSCSLNIRFGPDHALTVRWPAAQDNRTVAGYWIRLSRSDGQIVEKDAGNQLNWTFDSVSSLYAYEVKVFAYDAESSIVKELSLSRLTGWIKPDGAAGDARPTDYFKDWQESVWQIDAVIHHWQPDAQGLLRPLEVPWDVSAIYPDRSLPQPSEWDGFTAMAWAAAILILPALLLMMQQLARRRALVRFSANIPTAR